MKLRTAFLVLICFGLAPFFGASIHPVRAEGPLRSLFMGQSSSSSESSDGYGSRFNDLSCAKLTKLAARIGSSGNYHSETQPTYHLTYGPDKAQALDVYAPREATGAAPIIVMVHGGAWCIGDMTGKTVIDNKIARWSPKGFIFVSVNYRMLPENADVMTQAADVATAIAFVQSHAAQWNGNPSEIIVMGHSAGAHLVSLLSSDQALAAKYGARPWLGTVSLDSAALDVPPIMQKQHPLFYDDAFGANQAYWVEASPYRHISQSSLPWLGICSTKRKDSCPQSHAYSEAAGKSGVKAGVLEEDLKHGQTSSYLGEDSNYTRQVEIFMGSLNQDVKNHLDKAE